MQLAILVSLLVASAHGASSDLAQERDPAPPMSRGTFSYPRVPPAHRYLRQLLDNAFGYLDPAHGILDPASGYPVEGWNQDPRQGLFLRSFTQLTAIGLWAELLATIAAGDADNPYVSREAALAGLERLLTSLLTDQRDPDLAAQGLLVNFLGLEGGRRQGPLRETLEKRDVIETFGSDQGEAIWRALVAQGWLQEADAGRRGRIQRQEGYGANHFDGALAPYATEPLRSRIMELLDRRALTIVFGDNANLSAALARASGALLRPEIRNDPRARALSSRIERFLDAQRAGYARLYDPVTATFAFGWDARADRFLGWNDGQGQWVTGQMNYLINEFRGPWVFVLVRYGLPVAALRNAGFKIKPYRDAGGRDLQALVAWEGSAFQLLGLSLFMHELDNPAWRRSLATLVDIELDAARRGALPGLLSEAYSGRGSEYTGLIGIPALAVTDQPLNTHSASLYSLGVAYGIAPEPVEAFLRANWPTITKLFTEHGPWEGWDSAHQRVIPYQTTAHTLALILGGVSASQENMHRYLEARGLLTPLAALYAPGDRLDLLEAQNHILTWTSDGAPIAFSRGEHDCRFAANVGESGGMVFVLPEGKTTSLSNGRLRLRFRSASTLPRVVISFKRADNDPLPPPSIPIEIMTRLARATDGTLDIVLPATPALTGIHEIGLTLHQPGQPAPVDLGLDEFAFIPFETALEIAP